ncbi:MAG: quinone oxidoreductase [Proteobacteria bacterium]|nr:quinone oxidoreductase [Pseudomonadota bacterium]
MADSMKAVQAMSFGGPDVMQLNEIEKPEPGEGDLLVKIDGAGVNYADVYLRQGARGGDLPMTMGLEAVGTVAGMGAGVSGYSEGDRVVYRGGTSGCYAEFGTVPAKNACPVPDDVSDDIAQALHLQGMTAHYLAYDVHPLKAGESCLIHAGAGGVGHILIQLAKAKGATVYTTVGTVEKAELAAGYGADEVILYRDINFKDIVLERTGGKGVAAVYDSVGASTILDSIAYAGFRGVVAWFGDASGRPPEIDARILGAKCAYLTRVGLGPYVADRETLMRRCNDLFALLADGKLSVNVAPTRPLAEAAQAHTDLESRGTVGKLILNP